MTPDSQKKRKPHPRVTEARNPASTGLESRPAREILAMMNREDRKVAVAVAKVIPQITRTVEMAVGTIASGGRVIYAGAGTSGRLGVLDATECLPTFSTDKIMAVMAGGRSAMFRSVEGAEDNPAQARRDLERLRISPKDLVIGLSVSGRTPYTLEAVRFAGRRGAMTAAVTCNPEGPIKALVDVSIVPMVGPEVIAGSSRLKAGTAEKMILNMISTATMVRLGRTLSGRMINVRISNSKLRERGESILMETAGASRTEARRALRSAKGQLPVAMLMILKKISFRKARALLQGSKNPAVILRDASAKAARASR